MNHSKNYNVFFIWIWNFENKHKNNNSSNKWMHRFYCYHGFYYYFIFICFRNTDVFVSHQYHLTFHTSDLYMSFPLPIMTIFNFLLEKHLYNFSHKLLKSLCWSTPKLITLSSELPQKYLYLLPYILSVLFYISPMSQ